MDDKLEITRIFDAPVEKVWEAWITPEIFKKWWGPKDFTCPVAKLDFRERGKYHVAMQGAAAPGAPVQDFWSTGTYEEIVPMQKITVTDSFADENGNIVPGSHYGMENFPTEARVTLNFKEENGKTRMTLQHEGIKDLDEKTRRDMEQGWIQSLDKLTNILSPENN